MQNIIEHLNENLKQLYRQAVDADTFIESMQKQGKGKFSAIFSNSSLFTGSSKYFKPYIAEVAADVSELSNLDTLTETQLKPVLKKLEQLHTTLGQFKSVMRDAKAEQTDQ